ncbi:MAG TPA: hypothetical protein VGM81_13270 [Burkholderiaceae bacterium]|jgi:hypothetical protein
MVENDCWNDCCASSEYFERSRAAALSIWVSFCWCVCSAACCSSASDCRAFST